MNILKMFMEYKDLFLQGTINTILLAFFAVLCGAIIGTIIALGKLSKVKIINFLASAYIEIIRGTPVYVQILLVYLGITAINVGKFEAGVIALSINSGAYVAEIIRAGILGVDKGQTEAAKSLGMNSMMTMRRIILPQAIKNILPALGNEFVTVIKESAIIAVIGANDLMYYTNIITSRTYDGITPLIITAIIYFILTFTISKLMAYFERRMRESE